MCAFNISVTRDRNPRRLLSEETLSLCVVSNLVVSNAIA